eukprot:Pgem_evm1s17623
MKSALFEWQQNDCTRALELLDEGTKTFPKYPKMWMMKGQINEQLDNLKAARIAYNEGIAACPTS